MSFHVYEAQIWYKQVYKPHQAFPSLPGIPQFFCLLFLEVVISHYLVKTFLIFFKHRVDFYTQCPRLHFTFPKTSYTGSHSLTLFLKD